MRTHRDPVRIGNPSKAQATGYESPKFRNARIQSLTLFLARIIQGTAWLSAFQIRKYLRFGKRSPPLNTCPGKEFHVDREDRDILLKQVFSPNFPHSPLSLSTVFLIFRSASRITPFEICFGIGITCRVAIDFSFTFAPPLDRIFSPGTVRVVVRWGRIQIR